jgi:hypothetical protein
MNTVRHSDRERAARVKFLYHVDVDDPLLYDVVLNTDRIGVERGVRLLRDAVEDERFRSTPTSVVDLKDRNVVIQAKALFTANPVLAGTWLTVACREGRASVSGIVRSPEARRTAEEILRSVPGVVQVANEIAVSPAAMRV